MSSREHWTLRIISLLVIAACCIRCGGSKETLTINVPARPSADDYHHTMTAEEEEQFRHPAPIAPDEPLSNYALDDALQYMTGAPGH